MKTAVRKGKSTTCLAYGYKIKLEYDANGKRIPKQPLIGIIRQLIQKVVINRTAGREPAALEVHGRIASILAAMQTAQMMEARFRAMVDQDLMARQMSGEIDTDLKRKKLLDAYAEELCVSWEAFCLVLVL